MKKIIIAVLIALGISVAAVCAVLVLGRLVFLGRLTKPTSEEFVVIAQKHQYIVQAVYDYKAEHGNWPKGFDDLIPRYLPARPGRPEDISLDAQWLTIHVPFPHTAVCYCFAEGTGMEGWSARGDLGTGPLPLPNGASTRPALTPDQIIRGR